MFVKAVRGQRFRHLAGLELAVPAQEPQDWRLLVYAEAHALPYARSMATTVRVSEATRARAAAIAARRGSSIGEVVDDALDAYETAEFWRQTQEALAKHPDASTGDEGWERTTRDGLERD